MQSVTEIQLNKLRAHFRARFAPMIWANCAPLNVWGGGDYYIVLLMGQLVGRWTHHEEGKGTR